jgi:hypothetical protein
MTERHRQDAIDGMKYSIYCTYEMSNARYVNIIKVALLKWLVIHLLMTNDFKSVCRYACVSDGCLTVWWHWDRSCFSVSRSQLWCICTDLAILMAAGWTGSGSGGCCPWWSFWPSCDIGGCRCPGRQVVCPQWCVVQITPPSGEPCSCGQCSCRTARSQLCICVRTDAGDEKQVRGVDI